MDPLKICISSQTPLIRFKEEYSDLLDKYGDFPDPLPIDMLTEGEDYELTPGGVPIMLYPLLKNMQESCLIKDPHWISLNPLGPDRAIIDGIALHNISLDRHELRAYAYCKEMIWHEMHGLPVKRYNPTDFLGYAKYNWLSAEKMFEILNDVDIFYVHDFQLIQVGTMVGIASPVVFRWHIPFMLEGVSKYLRNAIIRGIEGFDSIVVSCKRDLEGLIRAGYRGKAYQIYPYVDPEKYRKPKKAEIEDFRRRFGLEESDFVMVVEARMDAIKGQDTAIKAVKKLAKQIPELKLVLVGNGSFSSSKKGGLAHPKSRQWRTHLEKIISKLEVEDRVIFTGYVPDSDLNCAYEICDVAVLPSVKEGFGLVTIEAWLYKKPVIVSKGAGSSELIMDGINGYVFEPLDHEGLAEKIKIVYDSEGASKTLGKKGHDTSRQCWIDNGVGSVYDVLEKTLENFRK